MSSTFRYTVDTEPMASELEKVSKNVQGTTAAVVAMESAVVAAEIAGSEKVCKNVNRGFFTLIQSQISQKIANKQSRVESLLMELAQQKKRLVGIKNTMEREYARVASRYIRIFSGVNKELELRIRQIDEPIFNLVNKDMTASSNRMNAMTAMITTSQSESLSKSQQILVSNLKNNAKIALDQSSDYLKHVGEQRVITGKTLITNPYGNDTACFFLPVVVLETISNRQKFSHADIEFSDRFPSMNRDRISNAIREHYAQMNWRKSPDKQSINDAFSSIIDSSNTPDRVKKMMMNLYNSSIDFETL